LDNIFKLHGTSNSIVTDRDAIFISSFWQALFSVLSVDLLLSLAYHAQTDGQTEILNRCFETYLRCMCIQNPRDWAKWLALAEWWYNATFQFAAQMTPYKVVYNQPPPVHLPYLAGESPHPTVDRSIQKWELMITLLKSNLRRTQQRMKQLGDKGRSDRGFQIGDWVWLKLQAYRQTSV